MWQRDVDFTLCCPVHEQRRKKFAARLAVKTPRGCSTLNTMSDIVPAGNVELVNRLLLDAGITTELVRFWREDNEP